MGEKKRELSPEQRTEILTLFNSKNSLRKIQQLVSFVPKPSVSSIKRTIDRYTETGSNNNKPRTGRPCVLNESDARYMALLSKRDRRLCLPDLTKQFNQCRKKKVSYATVRRAIHRHGLYGISFVTKFNLIYPNHFFFHFKRARSSKKAVVACN